MTRPSGAPNPRRVEAGRRNCAKRRGFTPEGLERLRRAALAGRPWEHATGPRTAAGKARSAANGKVTQVGPISGRELRGELAEVRHLIERLQEGRGQLAGGGTQAPPTSTVVSKEEEDRGEETVEG